MSILLPSLFGLAILDSINPSALAVTIYLMFAGRPFVAKVLTYVGAVFAPDKSRGEGKGVRQPHSLSLGAVFLLGITVTLVEFSTAFPYLGAIALMTTAALKVVQWLPILIVYNAIFVLPPLLLLASYSLLGERIKVRFEKLRDRFSRGSRETMLWVLGIVGFLLLADSLAFFDFSGLV